ncbi:hypothetical protein BH09SUM1_BH09SUM1_02370 [soil metagenome]
MSDLLIDTDVFSYVNGARPEAAIFRPLMQRRKVFLSFASVGEALAGARCKRWGEFRMGALRQSLAELQVLHTSDAVVEAYSRLMEACERDGHALTHVPNRMDAWIAATAIAHNMPLLTNNLRHFRGTPGLSLIEHEEVT